MWGRAISPYAIMQIKIIRKTTIDSGNGKRMIFAEGETPVLNDRVAEALIKTGYAVEYQLPAIKIANRNHLTKVGIK